MITPRTNHRTLADNGLHNRFRRYGTLTLTYRNKCIGMLPRIFKEKIYVQKGFDSIFEYAAKFAGLSREQVSRALNLHASFCDKPDLTAALETGEVSISKLARIASIATTENQELLADQARLLSKSALETLARDVKCNNAATHGTAKNLKDTNGLFEPKNEEKFVPGHKSTTNNVSNFIALDLSDEVREKLLSLKNKGLDINKILIELLAKRELEIEREKEQIALAQTKQQDAQKVINGQDKPKNEHQKPSRYIPIKIRRVLQKEHGAKCSIRHCEKPLAHVHHTQRFALSKAHNPHYLAPLCREHHQIAHSIDVKFHEVRRDRT